MKNKLSKFIGLLIAFFVTGSAHFIAGEKKKGIRWYLGLMILSGSAVIFLCNPGIISFSIALILLLAYLILWIVMLKQSF